MPTSICRFLRGLAQTWPTQDMHLLEGVYHTCRWELLGPGAVNEENHSPWLQDLVAMFHLAGRPNLFVLFCLCHFVHRVSTNPYDERRRHFVQCPCSSQIGRRPSRDRIDRHFFRMLSQDTQADTPEQTCCSLPL